MRLLMLILFFPFSFEGGKRKGTARYGTGKMQPSGKPGSLPGHTLPVRGGRQAPSVMSPERQVQDKQPVWRQDSSHTGKHSFHSGIDMAVELAAPVHATASGTVVFAGRKGGYGRCVIIRHSYGFETLYAHLAAYYTTEGKKLGKGAVIGFVGSTGRSTGYHLHYEIRKNGRTIKPYWYGYDNSGRD